MSLARKTLAKYGATTELMWRDAATALTAYEEMIEKAVA